MSAPLSVDVEGIAFWFSCLPDWETARAVIRGERSAPPAAVARPAPTLLAPTERRRAPDTVAVALEVAARACAAADRDPARLPSVFASTHGDVGISDYMCSTLAATPALISPIKFHNSVHNAAAGYWSIGTHGFASYTAVSAYTHTFGAGLLEAAVQAVCEQQPTLYVAFDIESKGPLATMAPSLGVLGVGLVLSPPSAHPRGASLGRPRTRLELQLQPADAQEPSRAASPAAPLIARNALAPCLPLLEMLAGNGLQTTMLSLSQQMLLRVDMA